ncbi:calcium-binding protein [Yoonia sp.]|uniref:calcium-binding protein n=1 Tax=Yoonia sp. TaxID=2212373 RepID=UPI002FD897C4
MSQISVISFLASGSSESHSRITDLLVLETGGAPQLYSATRYDGVLQHWGLSASGLSLGDAVGFAGQLAAGGSGLMAAFSTGSGTWLVTGGAAAGDLQSLRVLADGSLGAATTLVSLPDAFGTFQHAVTHQAGGATFIYGAFAGQAGIGQLIFDASGSLTGHDLLTDPTVATMAQVSATTIATVAGQSFLLTASVAQNGIASRLIAGDGSLGAPVTLGVEDSLWISAPSVLDSAQIGGKTYAILGAAGSQSLTVIEVGADGALTIRDHVMDSRDTRFGGITALEVIEKDGKTYVIAGGADDGVSVFVLLDGGTLVHRAVFEDTDEIGLNNISAIAAVGDLAQGGLDIFAASSSEAGVTQLRFQTGPAGITAAAPPAGGVLVGTNGFDILQGGDGDDLISGGAGDDILYDGAGQDIMAGGPGRDLFLLSADGELDTIVDFTPGEDRIDLSLWPLLRDISQLTISLRSDGMEIRYGDEVLIVQSADGNPIDYRLLDSGDLIGASRLSTDLQPGFPGPPTPVPDPTGTPAPTPADAAFVPLMAHDLIAASALADLRKGLGRGADDPMIAGSPTGNLLIGTPGADLIVGKDGNDTIHAGAGDDLVFGGNGNDRLLGGDGADRLLGGAGDDWLDGGAGDDILTGGPGADTFVFNAGHDRIEDFTLGEDRIILDARLWTGLTSAEDLLMLYATTDAYGTIIGFDTGDSLWIGGVTDLSALADDITLF